MASENGTLVNGIDPFHHFVALHKAQLETSVVPAHFWPTLYKKLSEGIFDAGLTFSLMQVDHGEDNFSWKVIVNDEEGVKANDGKHIYLVDHAWTFRPDSARHQLEQIPGLLERMANLFDLDDSTETEELLELVMDAKWRFAQTYSIGSAATVEDRMPVWYILDEFGSRIQHKDEGFNFRLVPFFSMLEGCSYSLLFPIKDVMCEEEITRDYLEGPEAQEPLARKALLNIWNEAEMSGVDWKQEEPEAEFFASSRTNETLADDDVKIEELPAERKIRVYAEYVHIGRNLTHPRFEMVDDPQEADILWLTSHFKQFAEFALESPGKRINQFPFEHVLTIKDLICIICRRMRKTGENEPEWLPTTYNLKTELAQFVSYFQHREHHGLDNHWIVKPWNLARGLDTHVTQSLSHILKLVFSGPKIVQKYLEDPVLFLRPEIGPVKFDIRFILLLRSVKPLKAYAYNRFWLRFANQKFELNMFDVYEKHFTVMNYTEGADLQQMFCQDFIQQFEAQYPNFQWSDIQASIFDMFKQVFEGACKLEPPQGIAHNAQSRAMYACDLMLKWNHDKTKMIPQILEINWGPDCKRACDYYPEYFNDVFSTLYLDEPCNATLL